MRALNLCLTSRVKARPDLTSRSKVRLGFWATLLLCFVAHGVSGALIDFTNFASYRRVDALTAEGNPLSGINPLDMSSAPWTWYDGPVDDPAPFWPVFDGTITYTDEITSLDGPTFLPDGLIRFEIETSTTVEARDGAGDVIGTLIMKSTEPHPFITDINPDRMVVVEAAGVGMLRQWSGEDMEPALVSYFVESETGSFLDDLYDFTGAPQAIALNALMVFPLIEGKTVAESATSATLFPESRLIGSTGSLVWAGQYDALPVPEPDGRWLVPFFLLMGAYLAVTRVKHVETSRGSSRQVDP